MGVNRRLWSQAILVIPSIGTEIKIPPTPQTQPPKMMIKNTITGLSFMDRPKIMGVMTLPSKALIAK